MSLVVFLRFPPSPPPTLSSGHRRHRRLRRRRFILWTGISALLPPSRHSACVRAWDEGRRRRWRSQHAETPSCCDLVIQRTNGSTNPSPPSWKNTRVGRSWRGMRLPSLTATHFLRTLNCACFIRLGTTAKRGGRGFSSSSSTFFFFSFSPSAKLSLVNHRSSSASFSGKRRLRRSPPVGPSVPRTTWFPRKHSLPSPYLKGGRRG